MTGTGVQSERELGWEPGDQCSVKDLLWDIWKSLYLLMSVYLSSVNNYTLSELTYLIIMNI